MPNRRNLGLLAMLAGVLPSAVGCLTPYAFPHFERTAAICLAPNSDIHVFRVDETEARKHFILGMSWSNKVRLGEKTPDRNGNIRAQHSFTISHGLGLIGQLACDGDGRHFRHDLSVILYRPGHATVRLRSNEDYGQVEWKPLPDVKDQLRELQWACSVARSTDGLMPGSASAGHRRALLFFASEFERLADLAGAVPPQEGSPNLRDEALSEAALLRNLADR
jgi:hypothetical protein